MAKTRRGGGLEFNPASYAFVRIVLSLHHAPTHGSVWQVSNLRFLRDRQTLYPLSYTQTDRTNPMQASIVEIKSIVNNYCGKTHKTRRRSQK